MQADSVDLKLLNPCPPDQYWGLKKVLSITKKCTGKFLLNFYLKSYIATCTIYEITMTASSDSVDY